MKSLAIFDMDETVIACDSATLWLTYLVEHGLAPAEILDIEKAMMADYHRGALSMQSYMDYTLTPLAGKAVDLVDQWADGFVARLIPSRIYPDALKQVDWHRHQGHHLLFISATADFIVRRIAALFGVVDVIAIDLQTQAGRYTGATQGILSFREGKTERLKEWLQQHESSLIGSYGYSDSLNDVPLLHAVENASVVNPAADLKQLALQHQWQLLDWQLNQVI